MRFGDAGLVAVPQAQWGVTAQPMTRNLAMSIRRTPHNVVREAQPEHVVDWGKLVITPNGQVMSLGEATYSAVDALDKAGPRGAVVLGAGAGFVFSSNRIMGALLGGLIGYFGGQYFTNMARKILEAQKATSIITTTATKAG